MKRLPTGLSTNKGYCLLKTKTQALRTIETKNKKTNFYYKNVFTFLPWHSPLLYSIPIRIKKFPQLGHVKSSVATYHGYNYHLVVISSNKHFSKRKWKKEKKNQTYSYTILHQTWLSSFDLKRKKQEKKKKHNVSTLVA